MGKPADIVIFAESGVRIGTGHVMRCLALAQSWKRACGIAKFVLRQDSTGPIARVREEGFMVNALAEGQTFREAMKKQIRSAKFRFAVLDGYGFGADEQTAPEESGIEVLFLDDYGHADHYAARWVLNHNPYAQAEAYSRRNPKHAAPSTDPNMPYCVRSSSPGFRGNPRFRISRGRFFSPWAAVTPIMRARKS